MARAGLDDSADSVHHRLDAGADAQEQQRRSSLVRYVTADGSHVAFAIAALKHQRVYLLFMKSVHIGHMRAHAETRSVSCCELLCQ